MAKKIKSMGGRSFKQKKSNNMQKMLQEAQKAQGLMEEEMNKLDEEFSTTEFEASSGGGAVTVIAFGNLKIKDVVLSEELKDEDMDIIKDMFIAATNEVIEKIVKTKEEKSQEINDKYLSGFDGLGI